MNITVYTDARVVNKKSTHSYYILHDDKFLEGKVFHSNFKDSFKAEAHSVIEALKVIVKKKYKNVSIFTDCKGLLVSEKPELNHLLKITNSNIQWISRNKNKIADKACRKGKVAFKEIENSRSNLNEAKKVFNNIKKPNELFVGHVTVKRVNDKEKKSMFRLYKNLTGDDVSVNKILLWGENRPTINTKMGRRYLVKEYIINNNIELKQCK